MNLHEWDLIIVNTSGGKDSQTMMRYLVGQAKIWGYDKAKMVAIHADLGRVEWKGVRALAETQALIHGLRFETVSRSQGDLLEHVEARGMWPSSTTRYCTSDHKRDQIGKVITKLHREFQQVNGKLVHFRVLNCLGFRAQESHVRAKLEKLVPNKRVSTQLRTVVNYHPILDWTEEQVWDDIKDSGVPYHPAYDLGMPRLSCVFCVFAPKGALMIAGKENPELLNEYVRIEDKIGHTFRQDFKIRDIKEALERGDKVGVVEGPWCM